MSDIHNYPEMIDRLFGAVDNTIEVCTVTIILSSDFYYGGCLIVLASVDGSADVVDAPALETIWLFENIFFEVKSRT